MGHEADLRNLQSSLKATQMKEAELQCQLHQHREAKMTEEAAIIELRQQLEIARQEREKAHTSAQAKETKLTADLEQYRIWYKAKTEESDRMVDRATELRNEVENLKVRHFFLFC